MKTKIIYLLCLFISLSGIAYSQTSATNDVDYNDLYIVSNGHNTKLSELNTTAMISVFGNPIKISTKKSKASADMVVSYIYADGNIDFENNVVSYAEIKNTGWAFTFKKNGVLQHTIP